MLDKLTENFDKILKGIILAIYIPIGVMYFLHGLFAIGRDGPGYAFLPLGIWALVGVVGTILAVIGPGFRIVLALASVTVGCLLIYASFNQIAAESVAYYSAQNVEEYYVYPADGSADEQKEWNYNKYVPHMGEAYGSVIGVIYLISVLAHFTTKFIPGSTAKVIFAFLWIVVIIGGLGIPVREGMDAATAEATYQLFWWGGVQILVWGAMSSGLKLALNLGSQGAKNYARMLHQPNIDFIWNMVTWGITGLVLPLISPGDITWSMGMAYVHGTALSATMAMEAVLLGKTTFLAGKSIWDMIFK